MRVRKNGSHLRETFHEAAWEEDVIMSMGRKGSRGAMLPDPGAELAAAGAEAAAQLPSAARRSEPPELPELAEAEVLRHYTRLSQMTLGNVVSNDLGIGTCTMKYNPAVNEVLARRMADLHPLQDEDTVQGMLEVIWRCEQVLKAVSGLDRFSFQPGGGTHGVFTNALIIKAYHEARGEGEQRDEIISTLFSHPCDAGTPATAGYKVITLYPEENGYPSLEALKSVLSERTAGLMITNPEDTGLYNPQVGEFVKAVHEVGGLCAYDQANANGILGVARARESGFDLCQFNLHKTFGTPHSCMGQASGPVGATEELSAYLPSPLVEFDGTRYRLVAQDDSIGTVRAFHGNAQTVLKAYAWAAALGGEGLEEVARVAVLNNNYLAHKLKQVRGVDISFDKTNTDPRLEQVRYSWQQLLEDTGLGTQDVERRMVDFGLQSYHLSHHPWVIPEPFTLEPSESFSKEDLDEYCEVFEQISREAYTNPDQIRASPHNSTVAKLDGYGPPESLVLSWRAFRDEG